MSTVKLLIALMGIALASFLLFEMMPILDAALDLVKVNPILTSRERGAITLIPTVVFIILFISIALTIRSKITK